jgi:hypothetical protein
VQLSRFHCVDFSSLQFYDFITLCWYPSTCTLATPCQQLLCFAVLLLWFLAQWTKARWKEESPRMRKPHMKKKMGANGLPLSYWKMPWNTWERHIISDVQLPNWLSAQESLLHTPTLQGNLFLSHLIYIYTYMYIYRYADNQNVSILCTGPTKLREIREFLKYSSTCGLY